MRALHRMALIGTAEEHRYRLRLNNAGTASAFRLPQKMPPSGMRRASLQSSHDYPGPIEQPGRRVEVPERGFRRRPHLASSAEVVPAC